MTTKLRVGVLTNQLASWERIVERWRSIEELGFDSVWLPDHFVDLREPERPRLEAWTLLPALAVQTNEIRIGTLVTAIPFRNPAFVARQAMTVDHISRGRMELGLGTGAAGSMDASYAMAGIEDWTFSERVERFREIIELIDHLLRNQVCTYEGNYYQVKDTSMRPECVQKPRLPITVAAHGPKMLEIAARGADSWSSMGGFSLSPDELLAVTLRRNTRLDELCEEIGRDPATLRRSLLLWPPIREAVYASISACEDILGPYVEGGINEFVFADPASTEQIAVFERIATDVVPALEG